MDANTIISVISIVVSVITAIFSAALIFGKYKEKVDQLEKKFDKIENKAEGLRSDVDRMISTINGLQKSIDKITDVAQSHSPISLTEKGEKLVEDSGFNKIFKEYKDDLVKRLHRLKPRSQYDVQEKARMMMSDMIDDERFRSIEGWAYDNGEDFAQIMRAGSIKLRDYYFEKYPDIVNKKEIY